MKKINKIIVIAEAGVNHNGSLKNAFKMIDIASKAGADFIKFQTFDPNCLASNNLGLADYQKKNLQHNNHLRMLKKLSLSQKEFSKISRRCKKRKIKFLSSPFDIQSIKLLKKIKVGYLKIPSGQIDDVPYLEFISSLRKKIFLSTGMSSLLDVKKAIKILTTGGTPKKNIQILHCVSQYPTEIKNLNLNSIKYLQDKLKLPVGFSDHSLGSEASLIAIGLGSRLIEKHFTLNKKLKGPDHKSSLNPVELISFIKKIRNAEICFGKYFKKPHKDELINKKFIRKRIVAKRNILPGEIFSNKNIITKRSPSGISASLWKMLIGKKSKKKYKENYGINIQ